ncbi:hypothetical protein E2C01_053685 [Portunus trituberculatus]|uniref:Uncharacterized protein n=1 Tax=Portunus trituberculatus TaxID=210409 RepID=A0A5B7GHT9_PORTR|nr:hypothetical protein [Portunus trituberculatus]
MKLGILRHLHQFFFIPPTGNSVQRPYLPLSIHIVLLDLLESKAFLLINSPPLTDCLQPLSHYIP